MVDITGYYWIKSLSFKIVDSVVEYNYILTFSEMSFGHRYCKIRRF